MLIIVGYQYCILVIQFLKDTLLSLSLFALNPALSLPRCFYLPWMTLAGYIVSNVQMVGLGQWEALVK